MNTSPPVHSYSIKCANCGAPLKFIAGVSSVFCEYCHTSSVISTGKKESKKKESKKTGKSKEGVDVIFSVKTNVSIVSCKSCFAEYLKKDDSGYHCLFCGKKISDKEVYEGFYIKPTHYMPFQIDEKKFVENLDSLLKKERFSFFYDRLKKFSGYKVNKMYVPFLIDDVDVYTDDKDLLREAFYHRNIYAPATNYFHVVNVQHLDPWNRNNLILLDDNNLGSDKVLLNAYNFNWEDNSGMLEKRLGEFLGNSAYGKYRKYISRIKKLNLVLLPIYECRLTYGGNKYYFYGNGFSGKVIYGYPSPIAPRINEIGMTCLTILIIVSIILFLLAIN